MGDRFIEYDFLQDIADILLDKTDIIVFISDKDTDEILYVNDKAKSEFDENVIGQKCYEVFQFCQSSHCTFCPLDKLKTINDKPVVWMQYNDVTHKYYKNIDMLIELSTGKLAHIHISCDISDLKYEQQKLQEEIDTGELLKNISLNFALNSDYNTTVNQALSSISKFLKSDFAGILSFSNEKEMFTVENIWSKRNLPTDEVEFAKNLFDIDDCFFGAQTSNKYVSFSESDTLSQNQKKFFKRYSLKSMLVIPVSSPVVGFTSVLIVAQSIYARIWSLSDIKILEACGVIISICSESKRIHTEVFKTRQTLLDVIDGVPNCIFWKDDDSVYTGCNRLFAENVGLGYTDIIGQTDESLAEKCNPNAITDMLLKSVCDGDNGKAFEIVVGDGDDKRWYSCRRIKTLRNNTGKSHILGIFYDITEKKKSELLMIESDRKITVALELAEASDKAKSIFLSRMSHEMRTPMNAIIGMSRIASATDDPVKMKDCLSKINSASKHLLGIINDVLDMSMIDSGSMVLIKTSFDLEKALVEICNIASVNADEKHQNLQFIIDSGVPGTLIGDERRLSQVIINLLLNAIKFTPENGSITVKIKNIGFIYGKVNLEFSVIDNGIGIDKEDIPKLFEVFEQLNGGFSRSSEGTGLGLPICKSIVEMMNGAIWVDSKKGAGSKFSFSVEIDIPAGKQKTIHRQLIIPDSKNLRLLFVDDSEEARLAFADLMKEYGMSAECVESGAKAIEYVEEAYNNGCPYSVIFMDYDMPDFNGIETTKNIKKYFGKDTLVVLVSSIDWELIKDEAIENGITKFLSKPLYPSQIVNTLNDMIGISPRISENKDFNDIPDFTGKQVLVVEDVEINRDIVRALLESTNIKIDFAENGKLGFEMFNNSPDKYDLILMDIYMPEMDGYESTKLIRASDNNRSKSIPIIAMTANVFNEDVQKCIQVGMTGHIGKPIEQSILYSKLSLYFDSDKSSNEPEIIKPAASDSDYGKYLPFINVNEALSRLLGNKKLYVTLLKSYEQGTAYKNLLESLENENIEAAQSCAHSLKGIASNLAFMKIIELITPLEAFLRRSNPTSNMINEIISAIDFTNQNVKILINDLEAEVN